MATSRTRQLIPVIPLDLTETQEPAFDAGSRDGYADAINGRDKNPGARFSRWHAKRPVSEFRSYETAYLRSYEQVRAS